MASMAASTLPPVRRLQRCPIQEVVGTRRAPQVKPQDLDIGLGRLMKACRCLVRPLQSCLMQEAVVNNPAPVPQVHSWTKGLGRSVHKALCLQQTVCQVRLGSPEASCDRLLSQCQFVINISPRGCVITGAPQLRPGHHCRGSCRACSCKHAASWLSQLCSSTRPGL